MKLECAKTISLPNATETDIRKAFADDNGRGEFIILRESDQFYIQAAGENDGPYILEYREGGGDRHYRCTRGMDMNKSEVESAFVKYLKGDMSWKTDFQWEQVDLEKPWWKFW